MTLRGIFDVRSRSMSRTGVSGCLWLLSIWSQALPAWGDAPPSLAHMLGGVRTGSWLAQRDDAIVKQNLEWSCGAASLATILSSFYGLEVSEDDVLQAIGKEEEASFDDLARVAPVFGFKAKGLSFGPADLKRLKVPVLLYLRVRGEDHFSVLRGVSENSVWLADPSWGNRILSWSDFLEYWQTRDDPTRPGKALLVLPGEKTVVNADNHFFRPPRTPNLPLEALINPSRISFIRQK